MVRANALHWRGQLDSLGKEKKTFNRCEDEEILKITFCERDREQMHLYNDMPLEEKMVKMILKLYFLYVIPL